MIIQTRHVKLPFIIRVISCLLIITFLIQDIAWSYPDIYTRKTSANDKLAPESFLRQPESTEKAVAKFVEYAIEGNGHISKSSIIIKAIGAILRHHEKWLEDNGIRCHVSENYAEALITFPTGRVIRYFDPGVASRTIADFEEEFYERLGNVHKQVLKKSLDRKTDNREMAREGAVYRRELAKLKKERERIDRLRKQRWAIRKRYYRSWPEKQGVLAEKDVAISRRFAAVGPVLDRLSAMNCRSWRIPDGATSAQAEESLDLMAGEILLRLELLANQLDREVNLRERVGQFAKDLRLFLKHENREACLYRFGDYAKILKRMAGIDIGGGGELIYRPRVSGVDNIGYTHRESLFRIYERFEALLDESTRFKRQQADSFLRGWISAMRPNQAVKLLPPFGLAIDPQKIRNAALIGVVTAPALYIAASVVHSLFTSVLIAAYVLFICVTPILTAYYIEDAVSFRRTRKDHGLIGPFVEAENIRVLETILDPTREEDRRLLRDIKGKISYFSYVLENDINSGRRKNLKGPLLADKEALRRMPKYFQWYIYLHEGVIHGGLSFGGKARVKTELPAIILNFTLPWIAINVFVLAIFSPFLPLPDILFSFSLITFNVLLPAASYLFTRVFGTYKSIAGHYHLNIRGWEHLADSEIDERIERYAHRKDQNGMMKDAREWLKGGDGSPDSELIRCDDRPDDILIVKGSYAPGGDEDINLLAQKIASSSKHSLILIIADNGASGVSVEDRKARIESIKEDAHKAMLAARPKRYLGVIPACRFVKQDVRSTIYDLVKLRELLKLYRRRLDRIKQANVEREVVASEVHGNIDRLRVALNWPGDNGYRREVFIGDYIGARRDQPGLEAIDILRDHIESGEYPRVELLMGQTEHYFLLAFLGTEKWTELWPRLPGLGGPNVMKSLTDLAAMDESSAATPRLKDDIEEARVFEKLLEKIARRRKKGGDEYMKNLREEYYRFHPKLLSVVRFMIDRMHFVYFEDTHHNVYLTKAIPENVAWRGLTGLEAMRAMEREFKEKARLSLWLINVMRDIWISAEDTPEAETGSIPEGYRAKVLSVLRAAAPQPGDVYAKEKREQLDAIERSVLNADEEMSPYEIFAKLDERMKEVTRPLPEIFSILCQDQEAMRKFGVVSPFRADGPGGVEVSLDTDKARQARRIELGVNTVINLSSFTEGILQELGQLRILTKKGELLLASVDALKEGRIEAETVLTSTTEDEMRKAERSAKHFIGGNIRFIEQTVDGKRGYVDLQTHIVYDESGDILAKALTVASRGGKVITLEDLDGKDIVSDGNTRRTVVEFREGINGADRAFARSLLRAANIREHTVHDVAGYPRIVEEGSGAEAGYVDIVTRTAYRTTGQRLATVRVIRSPDVIAVKAKGIGFKVLHTVRQKSEIVFEDSLTPDFKVLAAHLLRANGIDGNVIHMVGGVDRFLEESVGERIGYVDLETGNVYREDGKAIVTSERESSSASVAIRDKKGIARTLATTRQGIRPEFKFSTWADDKEKALALSLLRGSGMLRGIKSLESVTRDKLVSIEDIVSDYDSLTTPLRTRWYTGYKNTIWHFLVAPLSVILPDPDEKPGSSDMAAGKKPLQENREKRAATAFKRFAEKCRTELGLIKRSLEADRTDAIPPSIKRVKGYVDAEFKGWELYFLNELLTDSLNNLYAIQLFIESKPLVKKPVLQLLDDMERVLRELEKLQAAGRLSDAGKARVNSGYLDALRVLKPTKPGSSDMAAPAEPAAPMQRETIFIGEVDEDSFNNPAHPVFTVTDITYANASQVLAPVIKKAHQIGVPHTTGYKEVMAVIRKAPGSKKFSIAIAPRRYSFERGIIPHQELARRLGTNLDNHDCYALSFFFDDVTSMSEKVMCYSRDKKEYLEMLRFAKEILTNDYGSEAVKAVKFVPEPTFFAKYELELIKHKDKYGSYWLLYEVMALLESDLRPVADIALAKPGSSDMEYVGKGADSTVYRSGDMAVKVYEDIGLDKILFYQKMTAAVRSNIGKEADYATIGGTPYKIIYEVNPIEEVSVEGRNVVAKSRFIAGVRLSTLFGYSAQDIEKALSGIDSADRKEYERLASSRDNLYIIKSFLTGQSKKMMDELGLDGITLESGENVMVDLDAATGTIRLIITDICSAIEYLESKKRPGSSDMTVQKSGVNTEDIIAKTKSDSQRSDVRMIQDLTVFGPHAELGNSSGEFGLFFTSPTPMALHAVHYIRAADPDARICDLGSGNGAFCFFAGLYFTDVTGIEGRKGLFEDSLRHQKALASVPGSSAIHFINDDFLRKDLDLSGYDALYFFYTKPDKYAKAEEWHAALREKLLGDKGLKPGARLVVLGGPGIASGSKELIAENILIDRTALSIYRRVESSVAPDDKKEDSVPGKLSQQVVRLSETGEDAGIQQVSGAIERTPDGSVILLAGPSCSGKTTLTRLIGKRLGNAIMHFELDRYYKDWKDIPAMADGRHDFDVPGALDLDLIEKHVKALLAGESIDMPSFDTRTGRRKSGTTKVALATGQKLVIEGILALDPAIKDRLNLAGTYNIFVDFIPAPDSGRNGPVSSGDARLIRRIIRDERFRGVTALDTIRQWPLVLRGEEIHVNISSRNADLIVDTRLPHELSSLKSIAMPLLDRAGSEAARQKDSGAAREIERLKMILDGVPAADPSAVPENSILREFIGYAGEVSAEPVSIESFTFTEDTGSVDVYNYMVYVREVIGAVNAEGFAGICAEVLKHVKKLRLTLNMLRIGRQNSHAPCLVCMNSGKCPFINGIIAGKSPSQLKADNGCSKAKRCNMSEAGLTGSLEATGRLDKILSEAEDPDSAMMLIDELLASGVAEVMAANGPEAIQRGNTASVTNGLGAVTEDSAMHSKPDGDTVPSRTDKPGSSDMVSAGPLSQDSLSLSDGRDSGGLEREKILRSMDVIKNLSEEVKVTWVMPMYAETQRLLPKGPGNKLGEDALRKKVAQNEAMRRENHLYQWRIIAVDDGTPDGASARCAEDLWRKIQDEYRIAGTELDPSQVTVIEITQKEKDLIKSRKGGAVLRGLGAAADDGWSDYIGITDTDESTDMRQAGLLLEPLVAKTADVAIGSRWAKGASALGVPFLGHISSKVFTWFVRLILPPLKDIKDTQRGFKLFKREVVKEILPRSRCNGFCYDTELLLLTKMVGHRINEVPIVWFDSAKASKMRMLVDSWQMVRQLIEQRRRILAHKVTEDEPAALGITAVLGVFKKLLGKIRSFYAFFDKPLFTINFPIPPEYQELSKRVVELNEALDRLREESDSMKKSREDAQRDRDARMRRDAASRESQEDIARRMVRPTNGTNGIQSKPMEAPYKHILFSCEPVAGQTLEEQSRNMLAEIDKALAANGCDRGSVVKQVVFLKNLEDRRKCQEIMGQHYGRAPPAISYVIQPPADNAMLSVEITAIPVNSGAKIERFEDGKLTIVTQDGIRWANVAGLEPKDGLAYADEKATDIFNQMNGILEKYGFEFKNVVRTWIYQGDITGSDGVNGQKYDGMNNARWRFFKGENGEPIRFAENFIKSPLGKLTPYPASTGISMADGSIVMECLAIATDRKDVEIRPLTNPRQTEVYDYPDAVLHGKKVKPLFSRGTAVTIGDRQIVFISGTASIIKEKSIGEDPVAQAENAIDNVALVLNEAGANLEDLGQARIYVKNESDYAKVREVVERRLGSIPHLYVIAGVCRSDLLVELEGTAYTKKLPPARAAATKLAASASYVVDKPGSSDMSKEGRRVGMKDPLSANEMTDKISDVKLSDLPSYGPDSDSDDKYAEYAEGLASARSDDIKSIYMSRLQKALETVIGKYGRDAFRGRILIGTRTRGSLDTDRLRKTLWSAASRLAKNRKYLTEAEFDAILTKITGRISNDGMIIKDNFDQDKELQAISDQLERLGYGVDRLRDARWARDFYAVINGEIFKRKAAEFDEDGLAGGNVLYSVRDRFVIVSDAVPEGVRLKLKNALKGMVKVYEVPPGLLRLHRDGKADILVKANSHIDLSVGILEDARILLVDGAYKTMPGAAKALTEIARAERYTIVPVHESEAYLHPANFLQLPDGKILMERAPRTIASIKKKISDSSKLDIVQVDRSMEASLLDFGSVRCSTSLYYPVVKDLIAHGLGKEEVSTFLAFIAEHRDEININKAGRVIISERGKNILANELLLRLSKRRHPVETFVITKVIESIRGLGLPARSKRLEEARVMNEVILRNLAPKYGLHKADRPRELAKAMSGRKGPEDDKGAHIGSEKPGSSDMVSPGKKGSSPEEPETGGRALDFTDTARLIKEGYVEGYENIGVLVKRLGLDRRSSYGYYKNDLNIQTRADELIAAAHELSINREHIGEGREMRFFSRLVRSENGVPGIEILAIDNGHGMLVDVETAVEEGNSSTGLSYRGKGLRMVRSAVMGGGNGYLDIETRGWRYMWRNGSLCETEKCDIGIGTRIRIIKLYPDVNQTAEHTVKFSSDVEQRLAELRGLFRGGMDGASVKDGTRILLSENLFVKDRDESALVQLKVALGSLLQNGNIAIMKPEEMRRAAMNKSVTKEKMAIVMTKEDFENKEIWNGSDKETSLRSSVLILDDRMVGDNYLYLEGVIGLARAVMARNRQAIKRYYWLISRIDIDDRVLQLLKDDDQNNLAFAIKAILRFRPIGMITDSEAFNKARISMENALISA